MLHINYKVTSEKIRKKLLEKFPYMKVNKRNHFVLLIPYFRKDEFKDYYFMLRTIELINSRKENNLKNKDLKGNLLKYRGYFDPEINAYRIDGIIPKHLFDRARKEGLIFAIRFKSSFARHVSKKDILIWYIDEEVLVD